MFIFVKRHRFHNLVVFVDEHKDIEKRIEQRKKLANRKKTIHINAQKERAPTIQSIRYDRSRRNAHKFAPKFNLHTMPSSVHQYNNKIHNVCEYKHHDQNTEKRALNSKCPSERSRTTERGKNTVEMHTTANEKARSHCQPLERC